MTLFILGAISLAFVLGFRSGSRFTSAGHCVNRLCEADDRDQDVMDECENGWSR